MRRRPDLLMVMIVVFFVGTFGLNFQMTSALMATQVFHKGAGEYGILGSIVAIGSVSGALLSARRGRPRLRLIIASAVAFGIVEVTAGLMPTYLAFVALLIPLGLSQMTLLNAANATMQLGVDPVMRGRVMALYMAVLMGGTPFGAPLDRSARGGVRCPVEPDRRRPHLRRGGADRRCVCWRDGPSVADARRAVRRAAPHRCASRSSPTSPSSASRREWRLSKGLNPLQSRQFIGVSVARTTVRGHDRAVLPACDSARL